MPASNSDNLKFSKTNQLKKIITKDEYKAIYKDEAGLQRQCEAYLDYLQIAYIRVPDAIYKAIFGYSNVPIYIKKLISTFIKGLPDLTVLYKDGTYQAIELKTKAGKLSQGQKKFQDKVTNYHIVRSFSQFKSIIKEE